MTRNKNKMRNSIVRLALGVMMAVVVAVGNVGCQELEDFTTGFECGRNGLTWAECVGQ